MKQIFLFTLILLSFTCFSNVTSHFTSSSARGCSPFVVNLADQSTGNITSRHWDLGNGNISSQINPSATYFTPGTYIVKLIVSDGISIDSSVQAITVFSPPSADFISDRVTACPGDSIHFANLAAAGSAPISQYAWGFGNGVASNNANTSYRYNQSGTYDVTLVVQDTNGCDGHVTKTAYMTIWPKPAVTFTASPLNSCGPSQVVNFSNQSTGNGLSYNWVFGDSTNSTAANPTHNFSYGKYKTNLIVANSDGCVDSFKQNISIIYLQALFMASKTHVCAGETVHFLDMSPMPGTTWSWNFGDGTTSNRQNPAKVYSQPGVYSVTFVVTDGICRDSSTMVAYITVVQGFSVSFTADTMSSCNIPFAVDFTSHAPAGVSLTWSFGDGNNSTATNPSNTYSSASLFTVSLIGVDSSGCTVVATSPGFINTSRPVPNFVCDTLLCPGASVIFYNRTNNGTSCLWNFGDGTTSTIATPTHTYSGYGYFNVTLTAWDSLGCDSTIVRPSLIHVDSTVIGFDVDEKFSMCPPLVSVFSSHANRPDLKYQWDFGDGYTDTAANPTHIFFHPGVYTVKLMGVSNHGCTGTVIDSNLIVVEGPSGTFTMNPNSGCIPVDVSFNATTSANTQTVVCDLGDGTLYTDSLHFNYTYRAVNVFHPTFILTDQIGCSVAYPLDSIVTHPVPAVNLHDTAICAGRTVDITLGAGLYQWWGRNVNECDTCAKILSGCDTCTTVSFHPADTMAYTVIATNSYGCTASGSFKIMVDPLPVLNAQDTIKLCKNASVRMDVVQQAAGVLWSPSSYLSSTTAFQPTSTPAEDITYLISAYNNLGCVVSETVPVKVYDKIPLSVTGDTAVCAGSPVQLGAFVTDPFFHSVVYSWAPSPYLSSDNTPDPIATVQSGPETFRVTATSGSCIAAVATITVSLHPAAAVTLPATIVTSPFAEVSITPVSGDLVSYQWSAKDSLSCIECAATTLVPAESQVVYLNGTNQYGCTTGDSMLIHVVNCDPAAIFVPNTFTPNGDGSNDKLYVRSKTLAQLEYFRLFNRWGAVVFETRNVADGWDGSINGKLAEEGTYVYQISGKCENGYDVQTSGTVTLIR